jgi:hypothetical protein
MLLTFAPHFNLAPAPLLRKKMGVSDGNMGLCAPLFGPETAR